MASTAVSDDVRALPESAPDACGARVIAFYLPQYHPIPENDAWWEPGFTEWTNVGRAKPLFAGHWQPRLPGELGFYDLRVPETRWAQAELARAHGIEGFCYWHYWFAGKRLLERPFNEVVSSGEPDLPFCVAWANQTWTGVWHGAPDRILQEQTYPGLADHQAHFQALLPAFQDERYIRVGGKPLFVIFDPLHLPAAPETLNVWRELADKAGLPGLHVLALFHGATPEYAAGMGFDGCIEACATRVRDMHQVSGRRDKIIDTLAHFVRGGPRDVYEYRDAMRYFLNESARTANVHPSIVPGWDNTPRSGLRGVVLKNATPELFRQHVQEAQALVRHKPPEERLIFIKSWNEWAEGNYMEPDAVYGRAFLETLRDELHGAHGRKDRRDRSV